MNASQSSLLTVDDYVQYPAVPPDQRSAYGAHAEQFGELYLPPGAGPHPTIILIHGGCWRAQYGLAPLGAMCHALRQQGLAVWNIEYRRLGNGGGWPTTFLDVAAAADHLRTLADTHPLDLTRTVAVGHSAGGHLALWLAARPRLPAASELHTPEPMPIAGVVSLAGIPDMAAAVAQNVCRGTAQELMGGLPDDVPARYAQGSPAALLPIGVPQRLINGTDDGAVPVEYVRAYLALAQQHGEPVHLDVLPRTGHFEIVTPGTTAWSVVEKAVMEMAA